MVNAFFTRCAFAVVGLWLLHTLAATPLSMLSPADADEWMRFRGPDGLGVSPDKGVPTTWSATENILWKADLPGPGSSSPITVGDRVFITCYSGYGVGDTPGEQKDLMRHVLCLDRKSGDVQWKKEFAPVLPEHEYQGEGSYHGYAASTPVSDGKFVYIFFGKSGVYCLDLEGNEKWHKTVGDGTSGWGSGTSPILDGNRLIVNASVESRSLVCFDKASGEELWRSPNINASWNTPVVFKSLAKPELVVSVEAWLFGIDLSSGKELWRADGVHRYVCPSVVYHDDIVYAIGGGHTSVAVRAGGEGDVTASNTVWRDTKGSNVSSPVYHEGHIYWASDSGGFICCQQADTGETVYQERVEPRPGRFWTSPILADGKLYFVSQNAGTFVVAAKPEYELLAHNVIEGDDSRTNASPAISHGQLLLRTDKAVYCVGAKK